MNFGVTLLSETSTWWSAGSMGHEGALKWHHKLPHETVIREFFVFFVYLFNGALQWLFACILQWGSLEICWSLLSHLCHSLQSRSLFSIRNSPKLERGSREMVGILLGLLTC